MKLKLGFSYEQADPGLYVYISEPHPHNIVASEDVSPTKPVKDFLSTVEIDVPPEIQALLMPGRPVDVAKKDDVQIVDRFAAQAARIKELEAILEPFAEFGLHYPPTRTYGNRPSSGPLYEVRSGGLPPATLLVEHLHAAVEAVGKTFGVPADLLGRRGS